MNCNPKRRTIIIRIALTGADLLERNFARAKAVIISQVTGVSIYVLCAVEGHCDALGTRTGTEISTN